MIELTATVEVKDDWELFTFARRFAAADKAGLEAGAKVLERQEIRQIGRIAQRRIPTRREVAAYRQRKNTKKKRRRELRASDAPAWARSGDTQRGVTVTYPERHKAVIDVEGRASAYAPSRAALGVGWTPKRPALGIVRKNPFDIDTPRISGEQAQKVYQQSFENELKGKRL